MKMGLLSASFWGVFLIVFGIALLLKYVLNIDFPVVRVMISLLLIYLGVVLMFGKSIRSYEQKVIFGEADVEYKSGKKKYECVFGKASLDLTNLKLETDEKIKVSCLFGEYIVFINPELNYEIQSSSAFGSFEMPGRDNLSFGDATYKRKDFDPSLPKLTIKAEVAFGSIKIVYRR